MGIIIICFLFNTMCTNRIAAFCELLDASKQSQIFTKFITYGCSYSFCTKRMMIL